MVRYFIQTTPIIDMDYRINKKITAKEVNLISPEGKRLGIFSLTEAFAQAKSLNLDLVEINPSENLPTCQIIDQEHHKRESARAYLNHLLTLNLRQDEAFGPLSISFIRENNLQELGLMPEEQFHLFSATIQAIAPEPKRYSIKLDLLKKAQALLNHTRYNNPDLTRQIQYDIKKTESDIKIYNDAMRPQSKGADLNKQELIVQTDIPDYFLDIAQKRAGDYYRKKYDLSKKAKAAQHFAGSSRKFAPENTDVNKEFPGACAPFMNSRTNAFHLMMPFDIKVSKKPDDILDGGVRIYYLKMGYSFPLAYENDKLVSYHDGQVLDIPLNDPNLIYFSVSTVKEREFKFQGSDPNVPPQVAYPRTVLERTGSLGPYLQIVSNFKIWFDASIVSLLIQGAPDLFEYGLQGGSGLMVRSHAADKVPAYMENTKEPWQDGLSFNFVNIHLTLAAETETAFVPYNTPLFTVYPVLSQQNFKFKDWRSMPH